MKKKVPPKEFIEHFTKEIDKLQKRFKNTSGHRKLVQYFDAIIKSDYFQKECARLRKKYKIPKDGFPPNPRFPVFPKEWEFGSVRQGKVAKEFLNEVRKLCDKFRLHSLDWGVVFEEQVMYGRYTLEYDGFNSHNLIMISDFNNKETYHKSDDVAYPVALRISPYATQRDILDFVKRNGFMINASQHKYKVKGVKIGKERKKNPKIQERNEFIYEHRHLPRKEILKLVGNKFGYDGVIEYGLIGKIISLEKKKRKEV